MKILNCNSKVASCKPWNETGKVKEVAQGEKNKMRIAGPSIAFAL